LAYIAKPYKEVQSETSKPKRKAACSEQIKLLIN